MSNFNLNKVIIGGRLTEDPELKQTQTGIMVTSFRVAVNRRIPTSDGVQSADFIPVVAWRQTAEFVARYFKKGAAICIIGSIQTRSWTDPNGSKRYAIEVIADDCTFVDSANETNNAEDQEEQAEEQPQPEQKQPQTHGTDRFEEYDIPF